MATIITPTHAAPPPGVSREDMQPTIDALAKALHCDSEYVAEVYWSEHARLCDTAHLQDFVPLFAERFTRDRILRNQRRSR